MLVRKSCRLRKILPVNIPTGQDFQLRQLAAAIGMNDHGKSGSDVENEKPQSGSSVSSELPREVALFPAAVDQHAAAAPRTFADGPPKTSTEMSRVAPVPGGAADDDESPADNP